MAVFAAALAALLLIAYLPSFVSEPEVAEEPSLPAEKQSSSGGGFISDLSYEESANLQAEIENLELIAAELKELFNSGPEFYESGKVLEFELEVSEEGFSPSSFTAALGDRIIFKAFSTDADHFVAIPKLGIFEQLEQGQLVLLKALVVEGGTHEIYCNTCESGFEKRGFIEVEAVQ